MVIHTEENYALGCRRALEALRNGVPNREAVRILGCNQPWVEKRFDGMLNYDTRADDSPDSSLGILVSGDFGSGKSHLLAHLEHQALSQNFVCSKVTISKETPLYDLGKVFKSAVDNGQTPGRNGQMMQELMQVMRPDSQAYVNFYQWANDAASLNLIHPIFPASLLVHERSGDMELNDEIESFWGGERIRVSRVKAGLRDIGQGRTFSFRAPRAADLPPQRLRFAIELIKAAGYDGWVVLIDEIELTGSYSILQRGRSYAEIARWMGHSASQNYPGLVVVGTVTDDFASAIISPDGDKKDRDYVGPRLEANNRYRHIAGLAETGMDLLERECESLRSPSEDDVNDTVEKLRQMYSDAYGWNAPALDVSAGGAGFMGRMRYKVRASINAWDLLRLFPDSAPDIVGDEFNPTYEENRDLERESRDDG